MFCCRQESTEKWDHNLIVLMETIFQAHMKRWHVLPDGQWKKHSTIQNFHNQAVQFVQHIKKAREIWEKSILKSIWRNHNFFPDNVQMFYSLQIYSNFYLYCFCSASHHTTDFFFCLDMFGYRTPLSGDYLFSQDAQHFTFSFYYLLQ